MRSYIWRRVPPPGHVADWNGNAPHSSATRLGAPPLGGANAGGRTRVGGLAQPALGPSLRDGPLQGGRGAWGAILRSINGAY
jgi:hypothetical protein